MCVRLGCHEEARKPYVKARIHGGAFILRLCTKHAAELLVKAYSA